MFFSNVNAKSWVLQVTLSHIAYNRTCTIALQLLKKSNMTLSAFPSAFHALPFTAILLLRRPVLLATLAIGGGSCAYLKTGLSHLWKNKSQKFDEGYSLKIAIPLRRKWWGWPLEWTSDKPLQRRTSVLLQPHAIHHIIFYILVFAYAQFHEHRGYTACLFGNTAQCTQKA